MLHLQLPGFAQYQVTMFFAQSKAAKDFEKTLHVPSFVSKAAIVGGNFDKTQYVNYFVQTSPGTTTSC